MEKLKSKESNESVFIKLRYINRKEVDKWRYSPFSLCLQSPIMAETDIFYEDELNKRYSFPTNMVPLKHECLL